jgi:hypothetical protein
MVDVGMATGGYGLANNLGGLASTTGLLGSGKSIDPRKAATSLLQAGAVAASGAATFSATAGPGGAIAAAVLTTVGTGVEGGLNAYDAQKTIARLQEAYRSAKQLNDPEMVEKIEWLMRKQEIKFNKGVANATLVAQSGVVAYKTGKAIYKWAKGTKGVNRAGAAEYFIEKAKGSGQTGMIARMVIQAVVAQSYEQLAKSALSDAFKSG